METNWPTFKLEEVLSLSRESVEIDPLRTYKQITVRLHHKGVVLREEKIGQRIKSKQYLAKEGQFIISRIDARNGAMGLVPQELDGAIVTNDFLLYEINEKNLFPKYFDFLTSTKSFVWECIKASKGTTNRVRLKPEKFLQIKISLPLLEEQKHIVARIESVMAKIEEARRLRAEAVKEVGETVENTHNQIFMELSQNFGTVQIQHTELDINPENINPKREFGENLFTYIDVSSVEQNTGKIFGKRDITGVDAPSRARRKMHKNDIVFSAVRPNLKKCFIVDEKLDGNVCSTGFTIFRIRNDGYDPKFLKYQLLSNFFINQCMEIVTGGHYPAINDKNMKNLEVISPPLPEQRRIVAYLDSLQTKVDELKKLQAETEKELEELVPSILDRAFKGEL